MAVAKQGPGKAKLEEEDQQTRTLMRRHRQTLDVYRSLVPPRLHAHPLTLLLRLLPRHRLSARAGATLHLPQYGDSSNLIILAIRTYLPRRAVTCSHSQGQTSMHCNSRPVVSLGSSSHATTLPLLPTPLCCLIGKKTILCLISTHQALKPLLSDRIGGRTAVHILQISSQRV